MSGQQLYDFAEKQFDLSQRIAQAVGRTDQPRQVSKNRTEEGVTHLGMVPFHLRHLYNLVDDLDHEWQSEDDPARRCDRKSNFELVREMFFASLKTHVPLLERCELIVMADWSVRATEPRLPEGLKVGHVNGVPCIVQTC